MKKRFEIFVWMIGVFVMLSACSKESEDISSLTNLPVFELTGGPWYVTLAQPPGTSFTDPGAKAFVASQEVPITSTGSVDLSTPGLYQIFYTAYDETGMFPFSTDRKILVAYAPLTYDYAGNYRIVHATRTNPMVITKMVGNELGWYMASDSWFQAYAIPVEFMDFGTELNVVPGNSAFGPFDGTVTYDPGEKTITFRLHFTSGPNVGLAWTTSWKLQ